MATRGAQPGNKNATKGRPWREAIDRAIKRDRAALDNVAKALIDAAQAGDMQAIKELGDRLDGKPAQVIAGDESAPLTINQIIRKIVDPS